MWTNLDIKTEERHKTEWKQQQDLTELGDQERILEESDIDVETFRLSQEEG